MTERTTAAAAATETEGELFQPSPEVIQQANVHDWDAVARRAAGDLTGFCAEQAQELQWYTPWHTVLDESQKPFFKWFVGGQTNIVHNALDR